MTGHISSSKLLISISISLSCSSRNEIWLIICLIWKEKDLFANLIPKDSLARDWISLALFMPRRPLLHSQSKLPSSSAGIDSMSSGKGYFDNSSFEATPYIFEKRLEYSGKTWSSIATSFLFQSEHSSTKANLYLVKFLRANVFSS